MFVFMFKRWKVLTFNLVPRVLFIPREMTLVVASHVAPKIQDVRGRRGGVRVVKCKIVAVVRKTQNALDGFKV